MSEEKSYNLFCFCMYYQSDFEFYGFKGLKLDFDKVWEFFHQKIEYFDTFVKADNIKKPENMQELTNLINYLAVCDTKLVDKLHCKVCTELYNKYPDIGNYFKRIMDGDLHHLIRLNDRNHFIYPHILQYQSYDDFYNTRSNDFRNACYTFFDDIKKKFEIINLYELIDFASMKNE